MDSGVGGRSIVAEIHNRCPNLAIHYLDDDEGRPYGDKEPDWLIARIVERALQARRQQPFSMIVIACNTASTLALPALREVFDIPVVGVVPAIKPAAQLSRTRHIGLLATPGTVNRPYTDQLIVEHAAHCQVTRLGTTELVELAEHKLAGESVDMGRLEKAVAPLLADERIDTIVLGCTHFPLLKEELTALSSRPVQWVDSGHAVARRVETLLVETQKRQQ